MYAQVVAVLLFLLNLRIAAGREVDRCPFYGLAEWYLSEQSLNCSADLKFHCCKNQNGTFEEACAKPVQCYEGQEPTMNTRTTPPLVRCNQCNDTERYQPVRRMSNMFSQCEDRKRPCDRDEHVVCSNGSSSMPRTCNCNAANNWIPPMYEADKGCKITGELVCDRVPPCPPGEERQQSDFSCVPKVNGHTSAGDPTGTSPTSSSSNTTTRATTTTTEKTSETEQNNLEPVQGIYAYVILTVLLSGALGMITLTRVKVLKEPANGRRRPRAVARAAKRRNWYVVYRAKRARSTAELEAGTGSMATRNENGSSGNMHTDCEEHINVVLMCASFLSFPGFLIGCAVVHIVISPRRRESISNRTGQEEGENNSDTKNKENGCSECWIPTREAKLNSSEFTTLCISSLLGGLGICLMFLYLLSRKKIKVITRGGAPPEDPALQSMLSKKNQMDSPQGAGLTSSDLQQGSTEEERLHLEESGGNGIQHSTQQQDIPNRNPPGNSFPNDSSTRQESFLNPKKKDKRPEDLEIDLMSTAIATSYRALGRQLELSYEDINIIDEENRSVHERCNAVLQKWLKKKEPEATYGSLEKALIRANIDRIKVFQKVENAGRNIMVKKC